METITIIGLGQVGASVGLALGQSTEAAVRRIGYDISRQVAKHAIDTGAIDQAAMDLAEAVRTAEVVLLALPYDQVLDTVERIAQDLKEGAVLLDCTPARLALAEQVEKILPVHSHYLGFTPLIGPKSLTDINGGYLAADVQLLQGGKMAISGPTSASQQALNLAADLASMLGASPLFAEAAEVDGLMAAMHILPQLSAAALTQAVIGGKATKDRQRFAGRAFSLASLPGENGDTPEALAAAAVGNRENLLRVIDDLLGALERQRKYIAEGDREQLHADLDAAQKARQVWWRLRTKGYSPAAESNLVDVSQVRPNRMKQFLGIGVRRKNE